MTLKYKGKTLGGGVSSAENVYYDNQATGMLATNVQEAIDELFTSVSNGKSLLASAITDMGVPTDEDATWEQMKENILAIGYDWVYKAGIDWREGNLPSSSNWYGLTYGDGKFVIVSNNNKIAYSDDLINWTERTLTFSTRPFDITYGNGIFVICFENSNKIAYSTDITTWTEVTLPVTGNWIRVDYFNGKFVSIGVSPYAVYSDDGKTWKSSQLPFSATWTATTFAFGEFYVVARNSGKVIHSSNLTNWTATTVTNETIEFRGITYGKGMLVAVVDSSNRAFYSKNGTNWSESKLPYSARWVDVVYGDKKFVAIAYGKKSFGYSLNGIDWALANEAPTDLGYYRLKCEKNIFIAVAYSTSKFAYSLNADIDPLSVLTDSILSNIVNDIPSATSGDLI